MIYGGDSGLQDLREVVQTTVSELLPHLDKFDSIAVSGTSGLVVGAPVSIMTGIPLVVVRKKNDGSHSGRLVEGADQMGDRVLFLDDFTSTGRTRAWVRRYVKTHGAELVGQYTYAYGEGGDDADGNPVRAMWFAPGYFDGAKTWSDFENADVSW